MTCTAGLTLLLATVSAIVGLLFLILAVATPNWYSVSVDRNNIIYDMQPEETTTEVEETFSTITDKPEWGEFVTKDVNVHVPVPTFNFDIKTSPTTPPTTTTTTEPSTIPFMQTCNHYYCYTRNVGIYVMCFMTDYPPGLTSACQTVTYYASSEYRKNLVFTKNHWVKIHCARSAMYFFAIGGAIIAIVVILIYLTCCIHWSPKYIGCNALLSIVGFFCMVVAMACFHVALVYEMYTWEPIVHSNSDVTYNWSYFLGWVGIAFILASSCMYNFAAACRFEYDENFNEFFQNRVNWSSIKYRGRKDDY